jgi:hypothetical protein
MSQLMERVELPAASHPLRRAELVQHVLLVSAGYYAAGLFGLLFKFPPVGITVIWPTAILLAALFLTQPRYWWMDLLAVVPTHLQLVLNFRHPAPSVVVARGRGSFAMQSAENVLCCRSS